MQSVNQVRQLYVVNAVQNSTASSKGDVVVKKGPAGVFVQYIGEGGLITSDKIVPGQIISAKAIKASDAQKKLKQAVIILNSSVNSGNPIAGQDYIVDIDVRNYVALGEYQTLNKYGAVAATSGMSASDFYKTLAKSLAMNFSREINHFFKFYLTKETSSHGTDNTKWEEVTVNSSHAGTYKGIIISEQSQKADYVLGEQPVRTVNFVVTPKTVYDATSQSEVQPFTVNTQGMIALVDKVSAGSGDDTVVKNGYDLADLEWFCMGERGDQIRQMGYPRTIRTKYMVDPTAEYDVLDIAFYYQGRGMNNQNSDKLMTFLCLIGSAGHEHDVMNALIGKFNAAFGETISVAVTATAADVTAGSATAEVSGTGSGTIGTSIATLS